jgi:lipoprotein-releasing system ATP-binding protein
MSNSPILSCEGVAKSYREAGREVAVLTSINLTIQPGELVAILGDSGSGKTTLLQILATLDAPSSGVVKVGGQDVHELSDRQRSIVRNKTLGFVYQFHHLLPELSAIENTMMPMLLGKCGFKQAKHCAIEMLTRLGLEKQLHQKVTALSGGERQRVAVARAVSHRPACVLADEPTGNLDSTSASKVLDLIVELQEQLKTSFIIVTHDEKVAEKAHRVLRLVDGVLS